MNGLKLLAALAMTLTLSACQTGRLIQTTDRPGTGKAAVNLQFDRICQHWRAVTYDSKKDTAMTIREARANNAARRGFGCK